MSKVEGFFMPPLEMMACGGTMKRQDGSPSGRFWIVAAALMAAAAALVTMMGCMECISPVVESGERSIETRGQRDRAFEEAEPEREERR